MIGKLAPKQYRGNDGQLDARIRSRVALLGTFRHDPEPNGTTALATNPEYVKPFGALGAGSLVVGVALVVLIPFLRRLISDKAEIPGGNGDGYRRSGQRENAAPVLPLRSNFRVTQPTV
jgi:POT family proton-dependent oligopeptide transporter